MRSLFAVLIVWLAVGAAIAAPAVVENPAQAPLIETWRLHEVWRLGGDEDDPDMPMLGVVSRAAVDTAGNVFLMDTQLGHVLLMSPEGEYLGTIGAIGEGPGEVQRPSDVCLLASAMTMNKRHPASRQPTASLPVWTRRAVWTMSIWTARR